jgi:hypothetical protein
MATPINDILQWFKTGLKPTQAQFWASWNSFWHKDEAIPVSSIQNLQQLLDGKADTAGSGSMRKINGVWFDTEGNADANVVAIGNPFWGYDGDYEVRGIVDALPFDITDRSTYKQSYRGKAI